MTSTGIISLGIHHASGSTARVSTCDESGPILTIDHGPGQWLSITAGSDVSQEDAERFADMLVNAAAKFSYYTRQETARLAQIEAEKTYKYNLLYSQTLGLVTA